MIATGSIILSTNNRCSDLLNFAINIILPEIPITL
jgi:hypothetical protein